MAKTRSLKKLFHIVKEYHMYFNKKGTTNYMCHAAEYACKDRNISLEEYFYFIDACMELVHSYHKDADSLLIAFRLNGIVNEDSTIPFTIRLIENTWINFFDPQKKSSWFTLMLKTLRRK